MFLLFGIAFKGIGATSFFYFIVSFWFLFLFIFAKSQSFHTPNVFDSEYLVCDGTCIFSFFSSDVSNT